MTPDEILQDFLADRSEAKSATKRGVAYDNTIEAIKSYACEMCETALAELDAEIAQLKARVKELETLLNK